MHLKTSKGFTLIEIVIVIVILSIVSTITLYFFVNSLKTYTMVVNKKTLLDEGKLALERMCRDIRDSNSITAPASGGSNSLITFTRANATAQDALNESITFQRNGSILEKVKNYPAGPTSSLAANVSSFTVTRGSGGDDEITLMLTLSLATGEKLILQTKVYPKNLPNTTTYKTFSSYWKEEVSH